MSDEEVGPTAAQIAVQFAILEAEGNALYKSHDYRRALSYYSKALLIKPNAYNLVYNRGECYRSLGMISEAVSDADKLLELNPNQPKGHLSKATSLYAKGDFEMAMVWYIRGTRYKQEQDQLLIFQLGNPNPNPRR
jgi:tetratricopeptide repeat protein 25